MIASGKKVGGLSLPILALQIALIVLAFYFWRLPILQPIKLLVVLLHEMSHGLVALASGGTVYDILITPDEGGACQSDGGNALLIASAGYLGSIFFGGMILRAGRGGPGVPITYAYLTLLTLGAAVTVLHDSYSKTFALAFAGSFIFFGLVAPAFLAALLLRAIGTVSCLYALFDIYGDVVASEPAYANPPNDAETFAELTGIPPQVVGAVWLVASLLFLVAILRSSLSPRAMPRDTRGDRVPRGVSLAPG